MSCQLPSDCLTEIFEYLEHDKVSLHSCLLVNRLWSETSVRILWRDIWSYNDTVAQQYQLDVSLQIIRTLVTCLPHESKDLLHKNGIFIAAPTWKPPLFNYASFCKVLSIHKIVQMIQQFLEKRQIINSQSLNYNKYLLPQEILKMFTSPLRSLEYLRRIEKVENIMFTCFPGAKNCLTDLTELTCRSNIQSEFFYQLSQICYNIQSLTIEFGNVVSSGLADLISLQKNLKSVTLISFYYVLNNGDITYENDKDEAEVITSSLTKFSSTLIKLKMTHLYIPLSFIATFKNLQELVLTGRYDHDFINPYPFDDLQHVTFPQLKVLKFLCSIPDVEVLIKFLKHNGKNLEELVSDIVGDGNSSLYLAVTKFCPNLQALSVTLWAGEIDTLKLILNSCQYLESIEVWCGNRCLYVEEILEVIAEHSPENLYELKLNYVGGIGDLLEISGLAIKNLETFLISWNNRISKRSLSLILVKDYVKQAIDDESMKLIEKYKELGIIKRFRVKKHDITLKYLQ